MTHFTSEPSPPPMEKLGLVGPILATLFCCVPFGIVAIVFTVQGNEAATGGDYERYRDKADKRSLWLKLAVGIGLAVIILNIVLQVIAMAAAGNP